MTAEEPSRTLASRYIKNLTESGGKPTICHEQADSEIIERIELVTWAWRQKRRQKEEQQRSGDASFDGGGGGSWW